MMKRLFVALLQCAALLLAATAIAAPQPVVDVYQSPT